MTRDTENRRRSRYPYRNTVTSVVRIPGRQEEATFYTRQETAPFRTRRIGDKDVVEMFLLAFYFFVAALVPSFYWDGICRFMSRIRLKRHRRKEFATFKRNVTAVLGADADVEKIHQDYRIAQHRRRLHVMGHISGWQWKPQILVTGAEEVGKALRRGHGAIIWCDNLVGQIPMGQRALFQAGIEAYQLNVQTHGLSRTLFGQKFINPIMIGVENRFLKGRLIFADDETYDVTRRITDVLGQNGVVLIINNCNSGRSFVELPFGAGGHAHFATTPANFLARGKTALLGMSTVETAPFAKYVAVIRPGPDVSLESGEERPAKRAQHIARIAAGFRDQIQEVALRHPDQCLGFNREFVAAGLGEPSATAADPAPLGAPR